MTTAALISHRLPPPAAKSTHVKAEMTARRAIFYRNNDRYHEGRRLLISNRNFRTFEALLTDLSEQVGPGAIHRLYERKSHQQITSLEDVQEGAAYVCVGNSESLRSEEAPGMQRPPRPPRQRILRKAGPSSASPLGAQGTTAPVYTSGTGAASPSTNGVDLWSQTKVVKVHLQKQGGAAGQALLLNRRTAHSMDQVKREIARLLPSLGGHVGALYALPSLIPIHTLTELAACSDVLAVAARLPVSEAWAVRRPAVRLQPLNNSKVSRLRGVPGELPASSMLLPVSDDDTRSLRADSPLPLSSMQSSLSHASHHVLPSIPINEEDEDNQEHPQRGFLHRPPPVKSRAVDEIVASVLEADMRPTQEKERQGQRLRRRMSLRQLQRSKVQEGVISRHEGAQVQLEAKMDEERQRQWDLLQAKLRVRVAKGAQPVTAEPSRVVSTEISNLRCGTEPAAVPIVSAIEPVRSFHLSANGDQAFIEQAACLPPIMASEPCVVPLAGLGSDTQTRNDTLGPAEQYLAPPQKTFVKIAFQATAVVRQHRKLPLVSLARRKRFTRIERIAAEVIQLWYRRVRQRRQQSQPSSDQSHDSIEPVPSSPSPPRLDGRGSSCLLRAEQPPPGGRRKPIPPADCHARTSPPPAPRLARRRVPVPVSKNIGNAEVQDYLALARQRSIVTPDLSVSLAELQSLETNAAVRIQSLWRGYWIRSQQQRSAKPVVLHSQDASTGMSSALPAAPGAPSVDVPPQVSYSAGAEEEAAPLLSSPGVVVKPGAAAVVTSPGSTEGMLGAASTLSPLGILDPSVIETKYEIGPVLGDGNFAVVRSCQNRETGEQFALKIIDKSKTKGVKESKMIENEVQIMGGLDHPNCVKLLEVYDTPKSLFLVMELVRGGDLFDRIIEKGKFTEADASRLVRNMATAIGYLHSHNITHRDLKPENLLVQQDAAGYDIIKLGDFGLSMVVSEPIYTICGTPTYVAPEIIDDASPGYGLAVDLWAIGIIAYIMLCGFPPFASRTKNQKDLFRKIRSGRFSFPNPYWKDISADAKDLIRNLIKVDPAQRYTAEQILRHAWITKHHDARAEPDLHDHVTQELLKHFPAKTRWQNAVVQLLNGKNTPVVASSSVAGLPVTKSLTGVSELS